MRLYQNLDQAMRALEAKDAEIEAMRQMVGEIDRQHAVEVERLNAALSSRAQEVGRLVEDRHHYRAENERLRFALEHTQIGVNHIATYRTDKWPDYGTEPLDALEKLGAGREYDMWCCWNAAMCARDVFEQNASRAAIAKAEGR